MSQDQESGQVEGEQSAQTDLNQPDASQVSESAGQQGVSPSELAQRFDETAKELKERIEKAKREAQSSKDKEFANQRKEIEQLKESVVALSQLMQESAASGNVSDPGSQEQDAALSAVQEMFVVAGYGDSEDAVLNTPEFMAYVRESGGKFTESGARKYLRGLKSKPAPSVSSAAVAQSPAAPQRPPGSGELTEQYKQDMLAARGQGYQVGDKIKEKYRQLGVDVDNVSFSV